MTSSRRFNIPIPLQKAASCILALLLVLPVTFSFPQSAYAVTCGTYGGIVYTDTGSGQCRGFITTTGASTFTVPTDWVAAGSIIEVIGGGGGGLTEDPNNATSGGGGGGYSSISALSLTPGDTTVAVRVGAQGSGGALAAVTAGGDTFFNRTSGSATTCTAGTMSVCAKGGGKPTGTNGVTGGAGGAEASGIGTVTNSGGNGGSASEGVNGAGGGGAGGPRGDGGAGAAEQTGSNCDVGVVCGGGGGGGSGGGGSGTVGQNGNQAPNTTGGAGGAGGNNAAGAGSGAAGPAGGASVGQPGTLGGGGGGAGGGSSASRLAAAGKGGDGADWDSTHGAGGGGGSGGGNGNQGGGNGGAGGLYGGGGGGGAHVTGAGGNGAQGIIVITYTPGNSSPTLSISQPDGVSDTVTVGASYIITYALADSDNTVTAAFYYDTNGSGTDGVAITGACATAAEDATTCVWNTTGMTPGSYYVYGITNDGENPDVSAYSPGQITISAVGRIIRLLGGLRLLGGVILL